jgi:DNA-binding NarL/FixJ family response regulator
VQRVGAAAEDPLTPRQREVLKRIAEGRTTKEIAFDLGLSVKTVETHRAQVMDRLGIRDVAGLVRYAMRTGLVPLEK